MVGAGVAQSVDLFESTSGRAYAVQTIGWAQGTDTRPHPRSDPRTLRVGRRSHADLRAVHPGDDLRRRLRAGGLAMELPAAADVVGVRGTIDGRAVDPDPIPENTSRGNFTAHWGGGVRLRPRGADAVVLAYRFQHFSNGNQFGSNPGVNSHVLLFGWSHRS